MIQTSHTDVTVKRLKRRERRERIKKKKPRISRINAEKKNKNSHEVTKSRRNYKLKKLGVLVPLWQKHKKSVKSV